MAKSDKDQDPDSNEFGDQHRWQLAELYLKRGEHSANYPRALLFALSGGSVGFIASQNYSGPVGYHALPIVAFVVAIALLVWSWEVQKRKSIERFKKLRDEGYSAYRDQEEFYSRHLRNYIIDRWAYAFIFLGFVAEFGHLFTSLYVSDAQGPRHTPSRREGRPPRPPATPWARGRTIH